MRKLELGADMKKRHQEDLVNRCATMASIAQHIKHYIILYETDDGCVHRLSAGSQSAQMGLMEIFRSRIADDYRDYINHPKNTAEDE